ncbi:unnamed protein product [Angiostrongylus costaricensis]|uniref:ANK_REP_REGION domain-containing protein n=1 Tax=Angiostrongylus costaricensis TaxID=334426 RepID=A0A0R3PQ10_ANGCS|nr:unnamed protein product [Angiostrongylus costaricensis]
MEHSPYDALKEVCAKVVAPQLQRSQSARGLFIEDICATEGGEGDRLWLLLANPVDHAVSLSFTIGEQGVPAEEVVQRETIYFAFSVLHISAKNSQNFALKLLLSAIPEERKDEVVNIRNIRGQTPLHCAVRAGDPDSVHYLLRHGASTKILDNHKNSVVHYLADAYNEAIFKEILEAPSSQENDLDALNEEGFSPLHLANKEILIKHINTEIFRLKLSLIEMLLDAGASINSLDQAGRSVLLHAVNMNDFEIVQLLLDKGADPNVEDEFGETSLLLCMKTANYGIMGLLIDAGADPKKENKDGNSLIMSGDETAQRIISGERVELPAKEIPPPVPNDLTTTRSALFGRSVSNAQGVRRGSSGRIHCTHKGSASLRPDLQHPQQSSATTQSQYGTLDDISCLDYLTRLRLSKLMDENSKWQQLATVALVFLISFFYFSNIWE